MAKRHLDVACGIIRNEEGEILIALRSVTQDQGGLWEFPGGKVEYSESLDDALCRELKEELGILVYEANPWMQVHHEYQKYHVTLHVWNVVDYDLEPIAEEGQLLRWVNLNILATLDFPAANYAVVEALVRQGESAEDLSS